MPEFHQRVAVLQRLGYLEADKTVTMKGRGERAGDPSALRAGAARCTSALPLLHCPGLNFPPPKNVPPQSNSIEVACKSNCACPDPHLPPPKKTLVACEINSGDELVATELIFGGVLPELAPEEAVALLSALVFQAGVRFRGGWRGGNACRAAPRPHGASAARAPAGCAPCTRAHAPRQAPGLRRLPAMPLPPPSLPVQEKTEAEPELPPRLAQAREETVALALEAGAVQAEAGLQLTPEEFVRDTLKFGLMEVGWPGWRDGPPQDCF